MKNKKLVHPVEKLLGQSFEEIDVIVGVDVSNIENDSGYSAHQQKSLIEDLIFASDH